MRNFLHNSFQKSFIIGLLCCITAQIYAQSPTPIITINDQNLVREMAKQYKEIRANKAFGIEQLKQNMVNLKSTDKAKIKLPAPTDKNLTGADIYRKCIKSSLIIVNTVTQNYKDTGADHLGYSSGAILTEDGICITNYHVLKSLIDNKENLETIESTFYVGTIDGDAFPIVNILSYSRDADVAIFKINTLGKKLQPMPLGLPAETGSDVYSLSNPIGQFFFFSKGIVSRNINYQKEKPMKDRAYITADYARGSSGGPIIDNKGNLVGLVSETKAIYVSDDGQNQRNIQMVFKITIPVSSIRMLLDIVK